MYTIGQAAAMGAHGIVLWGDAEYSRNRVILITALEAAFLSHSFLSSLLFIVQHRVDGQREEAEVPLCMLAT